MNEMLIGVCGGTSKRAHKSVAASAVVMYASIFGLKVTVILFTQRSQCNPANPHPPHARTLPQACLTSAYDLFGQLKEVLLTSPRAHTPSHLQQTDHDSSANLK